MKLELPNDLTIGAAESLKERLLTALATSEDVELGGAAVATVDLAGLQVLCAAARSAAARGGRLSLSTSSDALARAIADAGFEACERWLVQEARDG